MRLLLLVLLLSIASLGSSARHARRKQQQEIEVDEFGEIVEEGDEHQQQQSPERSVTFANLYSNQSLSLYWVSNAKALDAGQDTKMQGVFMGQIERGSSVVINTFTGHSFYATPVTASTSSSEEGEDEEGGTAVSADAAAAVTPGRLFITEFRFDYHFGPKTKDSLFVSEESFYARPGGMHPAMKLLYQKSQAMSAKFRSLAPAVDMWYDDGGDGTFQGSLTLGKETTTNTYEGHVFYFTEKDNKKNVLARFTMDKTRVLYLIKDEAHPPSDDLLARTAAEEHYMEEYFNRTGLQWRHFFGPDGPRGPPTLFMWPAKKIGQIHKVKSTHDHWFCKGSAKECRGDEVKKMELEVVSLQPRVFVISNFLSDFEVDEIISQAKGKLASSTVGNKDGGGQRVSDTRTSRNAWVGRDTSEVIETIYLRAADLLNLDEQLLHSHANAEEMQVVRYVDGARYDSHHDWGVSGYAESRLITLLFYLTDKPHEAAGGETAFPKAAGGRGFKIHPGKGSAVLFYNLLEDGNGDDLALHAALPVADGHEKWLSNLWIWDPKRKPSA